MRRNGEDVADAPIDVQVEAIELEVELLIVVEVTAGREKVKVGAGQSVRHFWQLCTIPSYEEMRSWPARSD